MVVFPIISCGGIFEKEIYCVCATRAEAQEMCADLAMNAPYEAYLYEMENYESYPSAEDIQLDADFYDDEIDYYIGDPVEFL